MFDEQDLPEINLDELRREVQRRHLIPISEKDPVLAVASMIDLVTEQSCKRFLTALDQALVKQQIASTRIGENIVQQGADHMVAAAQTCIRDVLKSGVDEIASRNSEAAELLQQILN